MIIFFLVLFGLGVVVIGEKGKLVLNFFEGVLEFMFWMINLVMKFVLFGVFVLIGLNVVKFGIGLLIFLGKLVFVIYLIMIFFVFVVLGIIVKMVGMNVLVFIKILKDELILVFIIVSFEVVLLRLMIKMENFGCLKVVILFVILIGYMFNFDGLFIY